MAIYRSGCSVVGTGQLAGYKKNKSRDSGRVVF